MADTERLILASASPRRRELLARLWPAVDVIPCPYPEPSLRTTRVSPPAWATALAYFKARAVADRHPGRWVLGADTIVVCDGQMLGKPRDAAEARTMLERQARTVSDVLTGICLLRRGHEGSRRLTAVECTRVWMRDDPIIREMYLKSGDWAGKAGAYGIQDVGDRLVTRIEGSFSNVVGLPLERLAVLLAEIGWLELAPTRRDPIA